MNLIKELLSLRQVEPKTVTEGRRSGDMAELIEKYTDQEKMVSL